MNRDQYLQKQARRQIHFAHTDALLLAKERTESSDRDAVPQSELVRPLAGDDRLAATRCLVVAGRVAE
jgi:hypothetical protein